MTTSGGGNWPFERVGEQPAGGGPVGGTPVGSGSPLGGGSSGGGRLGGGFAARSVDPDAGRPVAPSALSGSTTAHGNAPEHAAGSGRGAGDGRRGGTGGRRRPPVWLLVLVGVVVVGVVVAVVLALTNRDDGGPAPTTPPAETVTLPAPTPTVAAIERQPGTAFQQALPATVLAFALKEEAADPDLALAGAVEGWRLTYTDGAQDVVLHAGQWRDAASADAAFQQVVAANPLPAADAAATPDQPQPEQGAVQVGGQQVGSFLFLPKPDGTATLWWTNTTAMMRLEGPATVLRDVYAAFPL